LKRSAYKTKTAAEGGNRHTSSYPAHLYSSNSSPARAYSSETGDIVSQLHGASANIGLNLAQEDAELGEDRNRSLHLFLCIEKGRYGVKLHQEPVTHIIDDRQLFHTLKRIYYEQRGGIKSYWSLRTVHSIHFMKVNEYFKHLLEITIGPF
jgi:hypothetical protein